MKNISHADFIPVRIGVKPSQRFGGVGLFALRDLPKDSVVAESRYIEENEFLPWSEYELIDDTSKKVLEDFCEFDEDGVYLPGDMNYMNLGYFMNHCCNGNVGFNANGDFVTMRDVKDGEELCYDYALAVTDPRYELNCHCKDEKCRKIITGSDWKNDEIMKKYQGYIHPEMQEFLNSI